MSYSLDNLIDLAILIMLFAVIVYCYILNKRLKAFSSIKQEMADIINQLNASTSHAQRSIAEFKNVVFEEEKKLSVKLKEASDLADELDLINKTGSNLADRIEKGLTGNNMATAEENLAVMKEHKSSGDRISLSELDRQDDIDEDENDLLESLRNVR